MIAIRRCSHFLVLLALAGCGSGSDDEAPVSTPAAKPAPPKLVKAHCAPSLANCKAASGVVTYVEAVDSDGDGDAHFVLASRDSITLPGITVIDCKKSLRPDPLPRVGDRISAAGPVYSGSYGQKQIEATELHVARG